MPFRKMIVAALALVLVLGVLPAQAQDGGGLSDDQKALLEIVSTAQQNFSSATSYHFTGQQTVIQHLVSGTGILAPTLNQTLQQSLDGDVAIVDGNANSNQTLDQELAFNLVGQNEPTRVTMGLELTVLDGVGYIRFTEVPRDSTVEFPTDWVLLNDASALPGMDVLNLENLISQATSIVPAYEFNEDTVTAIEEIETEPIGATEVRAFKVTLNAKNALEAYISNTFNPEMVSEEFISALLDASTAELTVYIATEDVSIRRIESKVTINLVAEAGLIGSEGFTLNQTSDSIFDFSGINSEIQITAPEITTSDDSSDDSTAESADTSS